MLMLSMCMLPIPQLFTLLLRTNAGRSFFPLTCGCADVWWSQFTSFLLNVGGLQKINIIIFSLNSQQCNDEKTCQQWKSWEVLSNRCGMGRERERKHSRKPYIRRFTLNEEGERIGILPEKMRISGIPKFS